MKSADYLIIGGGIAGTTAAEFIRMNDAKASITIVTEEPETLYSRVMLPHFLRDQVPFERLHIRKTRQYKEQSIELLKGTKADSINTQNKIINLSNGKKIKYKKLLISSGGKVNKLSIPGSHLRGVTYLRTIADAESVKEQMLKSKNAVVVGGGFIGIEYAQSFIQTGLETTCVIREPYFWSEVVGEEMGKLINKILENNKVRIISESQVKEFGGDGFLKSVKLDSGQEILADIVGVGIGIHMELSHLIGSGIKINKGVLTNEYLETGTQDVWAAGDIAEFYDSLFGKYHQMGNWSNAAAQGKVVGPNMVAGFGVSSNDFKEKFTTVSAYTISIFDKRFVFMGDTSLGRDVEIITRGSLEEEKLGRIYLKKDVIQGATLLNLPADRRPIEQLIKEQVRVSASREKISDTNFNLGSILLNP